MLLIQQVWVYIVGIILSAWVLQYLTDDCLSAFLQQGKFLLEK